MNTQVQALRDMAERYMEIAAAGGMIGLAHHPLFQAAILLNLAADKLEQAEP